MKFVLMFSCNVGYVNLMLIKLLMLNLHAQVMYICILVFLLEISEV